MYDERVNANIVICDFHACERALCTHCNDHDICQECGVYFCASCIKEGKYEEYADGNSYFICPGCWEEKEEKQKVEK